MGSKILNQMKDVEIFGIVVIYNKRIKDIALLKNNAASNMHLIVCDNSDKDFNDDEALTRQAFDYINMNGNKGLSCAYNRALEHIFEKYNPCDEDIICIFDDDTNVPADYFEIIKNSKGNVILPIVEDDIGIMSPVILKNGIAKRFRTKEEIFKCKRELLSGINSCMAIRAKIFKSYRYDEEMFLDYIDHKFIMDMRNIKIFPTVEEFVVMQNFSAVVDDKDSARKRFVLQKKDLRIFYKTNKFCYYYVVIKKHIKLMLKYRDIKMLFK